VGSKEMTSAVQNLPLSQQNLSAWLWILGLAVTILILVALRRKPKAAFYFVVCAALLWGAMLFLYVPPYFSPELTHSLADAFVIAALLAATVDQYVKGRVLHEVTMDVSKYLIGYRLPEQLQDRLRSIMQTQWIVRAFEVRIRLQETRPGQAELDLTVSHRLQNITSEPQEYADCVSFSKHERIKMIEQRCECDTGALAYHLNEREIKPEKNGGQILHWGEKVKIPPVSNTNGDYRFCTRYRINHPPVPERTITFSQPTIEATIEVTDCPEEYEFHLTPVPDQISHRRWTYSRLFLPGEQVSIQWERRTGAAS
jgi:hypothetical protein